MMLSTLGAETKTRHSSDSRQSHPCPDLSFCYFTTIISQNVKGAPIPSPRLEAMGEQLGSRGKQLAGQIDDRRADTAIGEVPDSGSNLWKGKIPN